MTDQSPYTSVPSRESQRVEFLSNPDLQRVARTVSAFLNAEGGAAYIGVDDFGVAIGLEGLEEAARRIRESLAEAILPEYPVAVHVERAEGGEIVVVEVPPGPEPPYVVDGEVLVRQGTRTVSASKDAMSAISKRRRDEALRWERRPALGLSIDDLNLEEVYRTAGEAARNRLARFPAEDHPRAILDALHLLEGGQITNAAAILFGRDPARAYPQTRIRAARFEDDDAETFVDNRVFEGHAFMLAESVQGFFADHVPVSSTLPRGISRRIDRPAYPAYALREALMNALVHRDYAAYSGGLTVALYPNRLEVWNSGELPEGMSPSDLKTARVSRPHNPDIAHVFFLRGLVERWGIGTRRIVEECRASGLPDPRWEEVGGGVRLSLFLRHAESAVLDELNERMTTFLRATPPGATFTSSDYADQYARGVSDRSARADLNRLLEMGFLDREGHGRTTQYRRTDAVLPERAR